MYNKYNFQINKASIDGFYHELDHIYNSDKTHKLNYLDSNNITSYLETFVLQTAKHHLFKQLNKHIKDESIEFWFKRHNITNHNLHWDRDEGVPFSNSEKYPVLSIVTFLKNTNSTVPTVITNIERKHNRNDNNNNNINLPSTPCISIIFPVENTQLVFKGGKYLHGTYPIYNSHDNQIRDILVINVWDTHNFNPNTNFKYVPSKNFTYNSTENIASFSKQIKQVKCSQITKRFFLNVTDKRLFDYFPLKDNLSNEPSEIIQHFLYIEKILKSDFKSDYLFYCPYNRSINNNIYDFILITVATDETNIGLNILLKSIKQHNIRYKVLGLDDVWTGGDMEKGTGGGQKINLLRRELELWSTEQLQNTIVLFTDAYDVLVCDDADTITDTYFRAINEYKQFNKVMFSGEQFCWPDKSLANIYPNPNEHYRFLNSGSFIGTAYTILEIVDDIDVQNNEDDQLCYSKYFIVNPEKIFIDYKCMLFQTLNGELESINLFYRNKMIENGYSYYTPCILHGNGDYNNKEIIYFLSEYLFRDLHRITYKTNVIDTLFPINNIITNDINTIIISLEKDVGRRNKLKYKLPSSGLNNVRYIKGVDGDTDLDKYKFYIQPNSEINTGEIGCFLSHYSVWSTIVKNKTDYTLVLEDDATFKSNFNNYLNIITDNFNKIDFDIILLACWRQTPFSKKYNDFLNYYSFSTNAHAYIITFNGAKKLMNSNCLHNILPTDEFFRIIASPNNIFNVNNFTILQTNYDICNQEFRSLYESNIIDKPLYNMNSNH